MGVFTSLLIAFMVLVSLICCCGIGYVLFSPAKNTKGSKAAKKKGKATKSSASADEDQIPLVIGGDEFHHQSQPQQQPLSTGSTMGAREIAQVLPMTSDQQLAYQTQTGAQSHQQPQTTSSVQYHPGSRLTDPHALMDPQTGR